VTGGIPRDDKSACKIKFRERNFTGRTVAVVARIYGLIVEAAVRKISRPDDAKLNERIRPRWLEGQDEITRRTFGRRFVIYSSASVFLFDSEQIVRRKPETKNNYRDAIINRPTFFSFDRFPLPPNRVLYAVKANTRACKHWRLERNKISDDDITPSPIAYPLIQFSRNIVNSSVIKYPRVFV